MDRYYRSETTAATTMELIVDRQYSRITLPMSVYLDCSAGKREARLTDLGLGGCYIDSIAGVRPEEVVGITMVLPNGSEIEIFGTVAYVHDGIGFGIQFNDMDRKQRTVLETLVLAYGGEV
ncbi:MAG TPA: PilZ domain-containing protein [Pyrinomonadaceae bacterium]|nr:PilZ domain-containing protein [Pyrinomonadaceae bacterium]